MFGFPNSQFAKRKIKKIKFSLNHNLKQGEIKMATTKRANGKIIFDAPGLTKAQVEKLADNFIEAAAPKVAKLAKPRKKKTYPKKTIMPFTVWYQVNRDDMAYTKKQYYAKHKKKFEALAKKNPLWRMATTKEFSKIVYEELKKAEPKKLYYENNI